MPSFRNVPYTELNGVIASQEPEFSQADPTNPVKLHEHRSVISNIRWTFGTQVVSAGAQWTILLALARWTGPSGVGLFAYGFAVSAPLLMFSALQLRMLLATDSKQQHSFAEYFTLRILITTAALAPLMAFAFWKQGEMGAIVGIVALGKWFEGISDIIHGGWQRCERLDWVGRSLLAKTIVTVGLFLSTLWFSRNVVLACGALTTGFAATLLLIDVPVFARFDYGNLNKTGWFHREFASLRALIWVALPLGYVQLLVSLSANIPRLFLEERTGTNDLGIFAALTSLIIPGQIIINALGQSVSPRLAESFHSGRSDEFRRLIRQIVTVGGLVGLLGIAVSAGFGQRLLSLVYGRDFAVGASALIVVMVAAALLYVAWLIGFAMTATRVLRSQAVLLTISTFTVVIVCAFAIPRFGLIGACAGIAAGALVQASGGGWILLRTSLRLAGPRK